MDPISVTAYPQNIAFAAIRDHQLSSKKHNPQDPYVPTNVQIVSSKPGKAANDFDNGTLVGGTITDFSLRYKSEREANGHRLTLHLDDHRSIHITTGEPESVASKSSWPRLRIDPSLDTKLRSIRGDNFGKVRKNPTVSGWKIERIISSAYRTSTTSDHVEGHMKNPILARTEVHRVLGLQLSDPTQDEARRGRWLAWVSCDRRTYSEKDEYMLTNIEFFDLELTIDPGPKAKDKSKGVELVPRALIEKDCEYCMKRMYRERDEMEQEEAQKRELAERVEDGKLDAIQFRLEKARLDDMEEKRKQAEEERWDREGHPQLERTNQPAKRRRVAPRKSKVKEGAKEDLSAEELVTEEPMLEKTMTKRPIRKLVTRKPAARKAPTKKVVKEDI